MHKVLKLSILLELKPALILQLPCITVFCFNAYICFVFLPFSLINLYI